MKDSEQIITKRDLDAFGQRLVLSLKFGYDRDFKPKVFYTPKEFMQETGYGYDTVIKWCQQGRLKARQEGLGGGWMILGSEIIRLKTEAEQNKTHA